MIGFSMDEIEAVPAWIPALLRDGYEFHQESEPGKVTGWDVVIPVNQEVAATVAKLKGLTVFEQSGTSWRPTRKVSFA
jgi:hypothetical protein